MTKALDQRHGGRPAFIARLDTIRTEIASGQYLVEVHAKHQAALGITYSAFLKLVSRYAEDAKPKRRARHTTTAPASALLAQPPRPVALPARSEGSDLVRHEPRPTRTFNYDGNPKEGDYERLIGPRKPKG